MATPYQLELVREFIDRLDREICLRKRPDGYALRKPGSTDIGHARYNVAGSNARKYAVYCYYPFDDPEGRFQNEQVGKRPGGWKLFISPEDADLIRYALRVLRSAYDAR